MSSAHSIHTLEVEQNADARELSGQLSTGNRVRVSSVFTVATLSQGADVELPPGSPGLSEFDAFANFSISALGSGVVVFPRIMADIGMIPATGLLLLSILVAYMCGLLLLECCDMGERRTGMSKGSLSGYEAMVQTALGAHGKIVLTISKNVYFCGIIIVYFTFETEAMSLWIPDLLSTTAIRWCVILPIFLMLAMLRDLTVIARFALVGIGAGLVQTLGLLGGGLHELALGDRPGAPAKVYSSVQLPFSIVALGPALSTFVFGFGCVGTLPSLRLQMRSVDDLPVALRKSLLAVGTIYMLVMWIGYLAFGHLVDSNFITSIAGPGCQGLQCIFGNVSALALIANIFISVPTFAFCIINALETTGTSEMHKPLTPANILCRSFLVVGLCFVSYRLSYAKEIISILSAVFAILNNVIFPVGCYHALKAGLDQAGTTTKIKHAFLVLLGLLTMFFGTKGGIDNLIKAMNSS